MGEVEGVCAACGQAAAWEMVHAPFGPVAACGGCAATWWLDVSHRYEQGKDRRTVYTVSGRRYQEGGRA